MVKETRIVFGLEDIRQVRMVCKCGGIMAHPHIKKHFDKPPNRCPSCHEEWRDESDLNSRPVIQHMINVLCAAHFLVNSGSTDEPNFKICFEIDGED